MPRGPRALCAPLALALAASCAAHAPPDHAMTTPSPSAAPPASSSLAPSPLADDAAAGVTDPALRRLLQEHWDWQMRHSPVWATRLGDHRFDAELGHHGPADIAARRADIEAFRDRAKALARTSLGAEDATTAELFLEMLEIRAGVARCDVEQWSVSSFDNPLTDHNRLPELHVVRTPEDGKNLLARYRQMPRTLDERMENLRRGLAAGRVASRESLRRLIAQIDRQLAKPPREWPLAAYSQSADARARRKGWSAGDEEKLTSDLARVVEGEIAPAFRRFRAFLEAELLPKARPDDKEGVSALPGGEACYRARIFEHIAVAIEPEELHATGVREIARINGEMRALGQKLFGTSDLAKILERLRTDKALYYQRSDELTRAAKAALDKARAALPRLFITLPRTDCVVQPVPDDEAPYTTIAYYREPHYDGTKPGEYFINTYRPDIRPRFEMEALSFHESIPGHHLQIALAQERGALPAFRKFGGSTAFVEGWALYTEKLADEAGLYTGDLDRMGMLSYDAWRASRLVVDTGLHHKGWTRAQAEQYMREHTALTPSNIENEVDRYIAWPGQALAYKVGQLEILRLREEAKKTLGDKFELRAFHDAVLASGAVSLPVLQANVLRWIKAWKAQ
ncbi:DUF885 domain-containing protein [Polyangium aurulentum]|uniref:DUF885 domain-containing protein n=1 Tax=Polyangium aurulentum TaxID=2567896 RepID=UPI0010ADEF71|nr:DUF885 domain-containing protein [Polyangium aurulentum]UQA56497.1 DUF885 domain-containing protein [Polyangium aurulentum]